MTFINYAAREINCKIVYYGPGLCGKTTNLQWIYDKTNPQAKKRQAQEQAHSQTQQKVVDDERRRIDEKFRDGI